MEVKPQGIFLHVSNSAKTTPSFTGNIHGTFITSHATLVFIISLFQQIQFLA
jgi:hypothetical protein